MMTERELIDASIELTYCRRTRRNIAARMRTMRARLIAGGLPPKYTAQVIRLRLREEYKPERVDRASLIRRAWQARVWSRQPWPYGSEWWPCGRQDAWGEAREAAARESRMCFAMAKMF